MRRIGLLAVLGLLALAGVAYATTVTNDYVIHAKIKPKRTGQPVKVRLAWDVSSTPSSSRPANTAGFRIFLQGVHEHTVDFPGCGTSTLSVHGPPGCPTGSYIGGGNFILEFGQSGDLTNTYSPKCRWEVSIFNGGAHNLSLYIYQAGYQIFGQPPPCLVPGGHAAIDVSLTESSHGMSERFSLPPKLLHPAPGYDASLVHAQLGIPPRSTMVGRRHRRLVGLFQTFFCPPNHQRQVEIKFTREDGFSRKATTLVSCTPR